MRTSAISASAAGLILMIVAIAAQAAPAIDIFGTDPDTGLTDFGRCQDSVAPRGVPMNISIFGNLGSQASCGISGAEFFIAERGPTGNDIKVFVPVASGGLGWSVSVVPNALAAVTMGNPFLETGTPPNTEKRANIAFPVDPVTQEGCQHGDPDAPPGYVRLYDASISKFTTGNPIPSDTFFWVGPGVPPVDPNFNCPLLTLCNTPVFTKVCVRGGQFIVNPAGRSCTVATESNAWSHVPDHHSALIPCTLGTAPSTWGNVKAMYR